MSHEITPFEAIRRTNPAGNEYWSSRDFARVLGYNDYRNFETVITKAKTACFNSGQRLEDHFVDITEMVGIGSGAQRALKTVMMSRYACYLVIQNSAAPCQSTCPPQRASSSWSPRRRRPSKTKQPEVMTDTCVTPNEAAKLLGVSADLVRAWCESGQLPSYRSVHEIDRPVYALYGLTPAKIKMVEGASQ